MKRSATSIALLFSAHLLHAQPATPVPATPAPAAAATPSPAAVPASLGEAEARKCEEKIASAKRDVMNRYDAALADLQVTLQKAADLEGALAVRAERQRAAQTGDLSEANFVAEPKALRALQVQMATRAQDLVSQLVQETVPRLVDLKKQLTVAGRLDEAVEVRNAIERLQNNNLAVVHPEPNTVLTVDAILRAYAADRARGDAVYKGQNITVRGTVAGYRPDPSDSKQYIIYLSAGGTAAGYLQCSFRTNDVRFREEKQFNAQFLIATPRENDAVPIKLQRGSAVDISGMCDGWEETVRLSRCEFAR
jgi:hypothetical protein